MDYKILLILLFIIILLVIFLCKEVINLKGYAVSKITSIVDDIKNNNEEFSHKVQENITSYVSQIKTISSNNLRELQRINLLNKQPVTKIINHFTETDPTNMNQQNDDKQTNYYMSSQPPSYNKLDIDELTLSSTSDESDDEVEGHVINFESQMKDQSDIPIYNYQEIIFTIPQQTHNVPEIVELDEELEKPTSLNNHLTIENQSNYDTNDTASSVSNEDDVDDGFDNLPVYNAPLEDIINQDPIILDENDDSSNNLNDKTEIVEQTVVEPPVESSVEPPVEPPVEPQVEPLVELPVEPLVEPPVEPPVEPLVELPVEPSVEPSVGLPVDDINLSLDVQLRNLRTKELVNTEPLDIKSVKSVKSCLSVVTDVPCNIELNTANTKKLLPISNYSLPEIKELCRKHNIQLSEATSNGRITYTKSQLYDKLKKLYAKKK